MSSQFVPNREAARAAALDLIPPGATVGRGDSITLEQIGIIGALEQRGANRVIYPFQRDAEGFLLAEKGLSRDEALKAMRKLCIEAMLADVFLTSTNAVTLDGKLVNIDAHGNRLGPMIFGPEKVIIVAGASKIVSDVDEALDRIHNFAAPMNKKRHALKHHLPESGQPPCLVTARCSDCNAQHRICRITVIIGGAMSIDRGRLNVILVGEELGI